jgi:hypothetical protein
MGRSLTSVAGVMVSIVAFQAVDPGSIPGRRTLFVLFVFLLCLSGHFCWAPFFAFLLLASAGKGCCVDYSVAAPGSSAVDTPAVRMAGHN